MPATPATPKPGDDERAVVPSDIGDYTVDEAYERGWYDRAALTLTPTHTTNEETK